MIDADRAIPDSMAAIAIRAPGPPEMLQIGRLPVPRPGPGQILVEVAAAGVNRPDVLQRQGAYPPPPGAPATPGLEIAGTVTAIGEDVSRWRRGDAVMALVAGGGYAEFALAEENVALPVPAGFGMVEAAAVPETFFTVWTNVFEAGRLRSGEWLLVHGGTSGIGTTAIMLAKARGAKVAATAAGPAKCRAMTELGADVAIDYRSDDFVRAVKAATGGIGADVILDMVGGSYVARNYEAAAPQGRIVQIAFLEGATVELDLRRLMLKRLTHTGSTLRSRPVADKAAIAAAIRNEVLPLMARGGLRPLVHETFPLADAAAAHRLMESSAHIGKIVLTVR